MELKALSCKNCHAPIKNEDIHWDLAMAHCAHCGTVFSLQNLVPRIPSENGATISHERAPVPMPKKIQIFNTGETFQITYRWFGPQFIFLIIFAVFWNGFMLMWHSIALTSGNWTMSLFGLLHTMIGLAVAYYTLVGLLNTTTVWIQAGILGVHHHPLPWPGNKQVMASDIEQIYCKEKVSHSRKGGTHYSYEVYAALRNTDKEKLLGGLGEPEQALYIEQELERYLGIRDRPVRGELPR
ncbi:MAG: hypothetical protein JXA33_00600 [Anaerolineae bacterium]|nr:hypothetical protein [Anaerolineae bacterium]